ncbi:MAG: peptidase domain-containing ABC transporter [Chitinophagaceae bacterium]|jgi:ATP-binding cassette subfamily B protein
MAEFDVNVSLAKAIRRFFQVIRLEKNEVSAIYFYAILSGLIQLSLPLGIQAIINFSQVAAGRTELPVSMWVLISLVVLGVFFVGIIQINQMKVVERIQQRIFTRFAFEFTYKIPRLKIKEVDKFHLPELVNRFFDTVSLQKALSSLLLEIPLAVIQVIFGLILLSIYSPLFVLLGLLLILLLYFALGSTALRGLNASVRESNYKYSIAGWVEEMARSFKTFKVSGKENFHLKKTDDLLSDYLRSRTEHFDVLKFQYWSLVFFKLLITATMLILGGILLIEQQLNVGQFIAAEIVIITVLAAVEKLILSLDKCYDVLTSLEKLSKVTDKETEEASGTPFTPQYNGIAIQFKNTTFSFDHQKKIIDDVSLTISAGQKICIMGDAGSGKSVLMELMTGAYPIDSGSLLIDSLPIGNWDIKTLQQTMGVFYHDQDIFHGTIVENIKMGNEKIEIDEIIRLSQIIGLHQHIASLPEGFNTMLNPAGKGISSIIAKKILLLRAFLGDPRLLLLDEPFELAAGEHSHHLLEYLLSLHNTTVVVVTGYVPYAQKCDQVCVLDHGKLRVTGASDLMMNPKRNS